MLGHLGVGPGALLGHGGEAWVYALDEQRVVRVLHEGADADQLRRNHELVVELSGGRRGYELPALLEIGRFGGRIYALERRLRGRSLLEELETADGAGRDRLVEAYLETADSLGRLPLRRRDYFGDLVSGVPIRAPTWHGYLRAKADDGLRRGLPLLAIAAAGLAAAFSEPGVAGFVHLDAYPGNMLTAGGRITAVLDVGPACVVGDTRFSPVAAAVYLAAPPITPAGTAEDVRRAREWLRARGLDDLFEPVQRWLAAYWAFAVDDPLLSRWCRSILAY